MGQPQKEYEAIKVGDTQGVLDYQILLDGVPIVIPPGTTLVCRWVTRDERPEVVVVDDAAGIVVDAAQGLVGYQRVPADVATARVVLVEFTVTYPSAEVHVSPDIMLPIIKDR